MPEKRKIFGQTITDFQAKTFEAADFYAKIEAARLMLWKACWKIDQNKNFRQESSLAKYLAVEIARNVTIWAADIFGCCIGHPGTPHSQIPHGCLGVVSG